MRGEKASHSHTHCHIHSHIALPSVSLEKDEETAVVVLGLRPRMFRDSSRVFLLAGPRLTLV